MSIKATNNFVLVIRDEVERERAGLSIPGIGQVKPASGTILSVGKLVKDPDVKAGKGKKCLFHATVGFELPFEDTTYLVLEGEQIIAMP